jgi:hypothetical protein
LSGKLGNAGAVVDLFDRFQNIASWEQPFGTA